MMTVEDMGVKFSTKTISKKSERPENNRKMMNKKSSKIALGADEKTKNISKRPERPKNLQKMMKNTQKSSKIALGVGEKTKNEKRKRREEDTDGDEVIRLEEKRTRLEMIESESQNGNRVAHSLLVDKPISPESGKFCPQTDPKARDQMNKQVANWEEERIQISTIVLK